MVFSNGVAMVAFLVIYFSFFGCSTQHKSDFPKNDTEQFDIVFVSIDTLRSDHLSCYGYDRKTSPFIDSLAQNGVRFEHARSASPWTLPAHTTMFTGQLPATHHIVDDTISLEPSTPVLPVLLKESGYQTGGFVSTLYVSKIYGFDRGFDYFEDFDLHTEKRNLSGEVVAEEIVSQAMTWWSSTEANKPVFLFLHFYDVHYEYDPPPPYDSMFDRPPQDGDRKYKNYFHFKKKPVKQKQMQHQIAQYDESIRYVDDQLKRIQEAADRAGRKIRWVITSDHGEEFGERGSWGHAHTLYAEQLHIPLIFSGAGLPTSKVPSSNWVGNHDIAPTIASWVGKAENLQADGLDLNSFFSAEQDIPSRSFLGETTRFTTNRLSLLENEYRLEWDLKSNTAELFKPLEDPKEKNNLAKTEPDILKAMKIRAEDLLGDGWEAKEDGVVSLPKSYALFEGRHAKELQVKKGDSFQVLPYDAEISFTSKTDASNLFGPMQAVGKKIPSKNSPLQILSVKSQSSIELDETTRSLLEQLGYIQSEEE